MDDLLGLFSILSDKTRLRILLLLLNHELCVCEIFFILEMSQPRVSRQLAILKQARLIKDRREGKWVYYKLEQNEATCRFISIVSLVPDWLRNDPVLNTDRTKLEKMFDSKERLGTCQGLLSGGEEVD